MARACCSADAGSARATLPTAHVHGAEHPLLHAAMPYCALLSSPSPFFSAAWGINFFSGVYKKLYGMDTSNSLAAQKLRARMEEGLVFRHAGINSSSNNGASRGTVVAAAAAKDGVKSAGRDQQKQMQLAAAGKAAA